MTNFQNLKIATTPEQPLDKVVRELERLGRKYLVVARVFEGVWSVLISQLDANNCSYNLPVIETTLTELKEWSER